MLYGNQSRAVRMNLHITSHNSIAQENLISAGGQSRNDGMVGTFPSLISSERCKFYSDLGVPSKR